MIPVAPVQVVVAEIFDRDARIGAQLEYGARTQSPSDLDSSLLARS